MVSCKKLPGIKSRKGGKRDRQTDRHISRWTDRQADRKCKCTLFYVAQLLKPANEGKGIEVVSTNNESTQSLFALFFAFFFFCLFVLYHTHRHDFLYDLYCITFQFSLISLILFMTLYCISFPLFLSFCL